MNKKILIVFIFICFFISWVSAAEQVNINTASLSQLDTLTGIGPTYAQRIIDGRPYSSIDDLLKVKGIGPATLQKIKDQGLAYVNCETTQVNPNDPPPPKATDGQSQNPTPSQTPTLTPTPTPTPVISTPTPKFPEEISGVGVNEILPNPEGSDETNEWIELYNSNNSDVDLSGWQIKDITGTITTFTIPQNTKISANGFLVFKRPDTKIVLNNDEDGLNLLTPDRKIIDSVSFTKAPLNQSYNKTGADWQWSLTLTPENKNIIASAKPLSNSKNSDKNNDIGVGLADLTQTTNPAKSLEGDRGASPWFLFFTALAITIISASIVLFIKYKIIKHGT